MSELVHVLVWRVDRFLDRPQVLFNQLTTNTMRSWCQACQGRIHDATLDRNKWRTGIHYFHACSYTAKRYRCRMSYPDPASTAYQHLHQLEKVNTYSFVQSNNLFPKPPMILKTAPPSPRHHRQPHYCQSQTPPSNSPERQQHQQPPPPCPSSPKDYRPPAS